MSEQAGAVTFKGNPLTLVGNPINVGDTAPDFSVLDGGLQAVSLNNFEGKTKLISVVPSLDTPVCDQQTRRFNEEAAKLGDDVVVLTVSVDLPFAQGRFCTTAGIENVKVLSDHKDTSFGEAYGVLIKELRLLCRAVFIVGADNKVQYAEVVKEVTDHPDYDKALSALTAVNAS